MSVIAIIAGKEIRDGLRNRWVLGTTVLLTALALTLAFVGSAPTGTVKLSLLAVTVVSLSSLTVFLLPLIALQLSYDAIVGEIDRGTMALLLAYPVSRLQVIFGKFVGHSTILAIATAVGFGAAGLVLQIAGNDLDAQSWRAFIAMIASSILLGATFLALGYLVSAAVSDRGTAGAISIGVWLLFVLIFDMALLGWLVADHGRNLTAARLTWLLLLNPTDVYRLFNLTGFSNVSLFAGTAGLGAQIAVGPLGLLAALTGWTFIPLALATALFKRRQL
jgi:Cu-processing system permease protein